MDNNWWAWLHEMLEQLYTVPKKLVKHTILFQPTRYSNRVPLSISLAFFNFFFFSFFHLLNKMQNSIKRSNFLGHPLLVNIEEN